MTLDLIKLGGSGAPVFDIQQKLAAAGFPPGQIDGLFGTRTYAAVVQFQRSIGLPENGEVDQATAARLSVASPPAAAEPLALPDITVSIVSQMFPQTPLDPIERNLPTILAALNAVGLTWTPIVLAAIATLRPECEGFEPIEEYVSHYNTSPGGRPFDLYDNRRDLGNRGPPDGASFKGRTYVQLTGRDNYIRIGNKIGQPGLVDNPTMANDPKISAAVLAAFVKVVELPMTQALRAGDLVHARRLVNGGILGLDKFVDSYRTGVRLLGLPETLLGKFATS